MSNTCTKDSNGNEEIFGNYTYPAIEKVITVGTKPKAVYVSRDPVSYTHLDVYKRQVWPPFIDK